MALRKEKIVEAAGVQRSGGAGEKEEVLGIAFGYLEIPLCTPAPLPLCNPAPVATEITEAEFQYPLLYGKQSEVKRDSCTDVIEHWQLFYLCI
ncbi:hypothetical protein COO91_07902 [Nostoc flagelliforme CCNUN1]|uniref:Uncharacterized protein n=1 Tax=Nostoc flagelliforme CCNUN1 TaxID=2038116 RepID=A0A2K8T2G8_9NOSO|nr:hypothetical protein [Nostoc flagelliforme]AUB41820.1 hypothetical protein COO91_07902 [Nostoc flagelliforme CCNUN1]